MKTKGFDSCDDEEYNGVSDNEVYLRRYTLPASPVKASTISDKDVQAAPSYAERRAHIRNINERKFLSEDMQSCKGF